MTEKPGAARRSAWRALLGMVAAAMMAAGASPARGATFDIFNAWWGQADGDDDGCYAPQQEGGGLLLVWDVDVFGVQTTNVFEKIYVRDNGAAKWTLLTTTAPHAVSGNTIEDAQILPITPGTGCVGRDYKIEVYTENSVAPVAVRDPESDSDLANHKEEGFAEDTPSLMIFEASWSGIADQDGDGCVAPDREDGKLRLNWDPDATGSGSITVFERVYARMVGAEKWTLLTTTEPHAITGSTGTDAQFLDIAPGTNCLALEYKIELYKEGQAAPVHTRDGSIDPDLSARPQESFQQDTGPMIADAWWSNVADRNQDGCVAPASGTAFRLNWDANVLGGGTLTVFERVYVRSEGQTAWVLLVTTEPHSITADSAADARFADITPPGNCTTNHYKIEVYRSGTEFPNSAKDGTTDPDLAGRREQSFAADNASASVRDAWWSNVADWDKDGCIAPALPTAYMQLSWDADTAPGSSLVLFARVYWRNAGGGSWNLATQTSPYRVDGVTTNDTQSILISASSGCAAYDYRIEVYKEGSGTPDATRDSANDADLNAHKEETWGEDNFRGGVSDAWWSNARDNDQDGCFAPASGNALRLTWNTDVVNGQTLTLFEKVYRRVSGTQSWELLTTTAPRQVLGTATNDASLLEVAAGTSCTAYDYRIEVYRGGSETPDYVLDGSTDHDLGGHKEEALEQDVPSARIVSAWWSNIADNDTNGCFAPATPAGGVRLNWDPDNAGLGEVLVAERIYWRSSPSSGWELVFTNDFHGVTAGSTDDMAFADLQPRGNCAPADYKIEIYTLGRTQPDFVLDPGNEPLLGGVRHETYGEDNLSPVLGGASWSTMVDNDGDGCVAVDRPWKVPQLTWSTGLSGTGEIPVFEQVLTRTYGTNAWMLIHTTEPHVLTNKGADLQMTVDVPLFEDCVPRDYLVQVWVVGATEPIVTIGPGQDPDLQGRRHELYTSDNVATVIANTWWSNFADEDNDGCVAPPAAGQYLKLNWDADVVGAGTVDVIERVYWKPADSSEWNLLNARPVRSLTGSTAADVQTLDISPASGCAAIDYRIELYRVGSEFADSVRDSSNDSNLSGHREETFAQDTEVSVASIGTNWWSQIADRDGDGCVAPELANGSLRLNWLAEAQGSASMTVYEVVYWRMRPETNWTTLITTQTRTIAAGTSELQSVQVPPRSSCATVEYRIDIFRSGSQQPDLSITPATAPNLVLKQELFVEDPGSAPQITTQPAHSNVSAGQTASFSVVAQGTGPLSYQWYFQATNMLTGQTLPTLTLEKIQVNLAGDYFAVVSNAFGSATSSIARLTVRSAAPPQMSQPTISASGSFQFTVTSDPGAVLAIETTTNLTAWAQFRIVTNTTGTSVVTDPAATNVSRFYRVRQEF